jgi:hypothetical protein
MRCPVCIEAKTPSKVFPLPAIAKRAAPPPKAVYYDESGRYHCHDTRPIVKRFECSNGHRFRSEELESCGSCDFGSEPAKQFVEKGGEP